MEKAGLDVTLSVPLHTGLKRGTLGNLIRDAGLTVDDFIGDALKTLPHSTLRSNRIAASLPFMQKSLPESPSTG
jgi:hypothetical protein